MFAATVSRSVTQFYYLLVPKTSYFGKRKRVIGIQSDKLLP